MTHSPRNRHERRVAERTVGPDRIVRPAEAEVLSGYCYVHLVRLEKAGFFPKRFKLSPDGGRFGAVGWRLSDIQAWIENRASQTETVK